VWRQLLNLSVILRRSSHNCTASQVFFCRPGRASEASEEPGPISQSPCLWVPARRHASRGLAGTTVERSCDAVRISAFTRVFDALWRVEEHARLRLTVKGLCNRLSTQSLTRLGDRRLLEFGGNIV